MAKETITVRQTTDSKDQFEDDCTMAEIALQEANELAQEGDWPASLEKLDEAKQVIEQLRTYAEQENK